MEREDSPTKTRALNLKLATNPRSFVLASGNSNVFGRIVVSTGFLSVCISARACFCACTYTSKSQNHCPRSAQISSATEDRTR
jgi:hypothetical protein